MTLKEMREVDAAKIAERLADARLKLREIRFAVTNSQAKNVREVRSLKREVARILTVMKEHETKPAKVTKES